MYMLSQIIIIRSRRFAGSEDDTLLGCGMYWCPTDTKDCVDR